MLPATKDAQLSRGELRMGKLFLSWVIFDKMVRSRAYAILIYGAPGGPLIGCGDDSRLRNGHKYRLSTPTLP